MQRRTFLKLGGGVAGTSALAGCTGRLGGDSGGGDDGGGSGSVNESGSNGTANGSAGGSASGGSGPITIGAIEPLSGGFTPWGQAHRAGLEFAVSEINSSGGVNGREIELVVEDTASDATEADSIFRRMVEGDGAVAITGPVSSDVGIRTARTAEELQVPLLLHMSGADEVLTRDSRYTFRVGLLPASTTMEAQGQLISDAGYERIGAVIGDYAWGQSIRSGIEKSVDTDVQVQVAPLGADDFKPFIRNISQDVEMMIATGHPPGTITIAQQQFQLGYQPEVTTGPSIPPGVIWGALGADATMGVTHIHLTDVYSREFADVAGRFAEQNDALMSTHEGYGYVTGQMLATAVADAGSTDPTAVADTVRGIEFDTIYANPIQYTEWGELKNQRQVYSRFQTGAPGYYGDVDWNLAEEFRTDPLAPAEPGQ
jgi:ABC-type branched-subunit amino acid transport system substrate-binding protein